MKKQTPLIILLIFAVAAGLVYAQAPAGQSYTVQANDWLSKLAQKYYDDALAYPTIVDATNAKSAEDSSFAVITNPNAIEPGQKLWIPAAGGITVTLATMTPTEVIHYVPEVPAKHQSGSCWTSSISSPPGWRCMVENEIFDPCLVATDGKTIVCGVTSVDTPFALDLIEPLPAPDGGVKTLPWEVELADGTICGFMGGTAPGIGDARADFGCTDQSYLLGDLQVTGPVWTALKATIGVNDNGYFMEQAQTVAIAKVWLPGESAPAKPATEVTPDALKNQTYQGIYDAPVQLSNGVYAGKPFEEGGATRPTVTLLEPFWATGDLNGDGVADGAAVLVENSGGSGSFVYLAAVVWQNEQAVNVSTLPLEDRLLAEELTLAEGKITLKATKHGPDDPMCCPSVKATMTFQLEGDKLVEK